MTGGSGSDYFFVEFGSGNDVTTDFDPDGGGANQDYLAMTRESEYRPSQVGDDTIVNFSRGHQVRLLNVDMSQITDADFGM